MSCASDSSSEPLTVRRGLTRSVVRSCNFSVSSCTTMAAVCGVSASVCLADKDEGIDVNLRADGRVQLKLLNCCSRTCSVKNGKVQLCVEGADATADALLIVTAVARQVRTWGSRGRSDSRYPDRIHNIGKSQLT